MKPSWWQMFEPVLPPEVRSLIGEIEPVKETALDRARRIWGMDERKEPPDVH
jgi:hypothetical protein